MLAGAWQVIIMEMENVLILIYDLLDTSTSTMNRPKIIIIMAFQMGQKYQTKNIKFKSNSKFQEYKVLPTQHFKV